MDISRYGLRLEGPVDIEQDVNIQVSLKPANLTVTAQIVSRGAEHVSLRLMDPLEERGAYMAFLAREWARQLHKT